MKQKKKSLSLIPDRLKRPLEEKSQGNKKKISRFIIVKAIRRNRHSKLTKRMKTGSYLRKRRQILRGQWTSPSPYRCRVLVHRIKNQRINCFNYRRGCLKREQFLLLKTHRESSQKKSCFKGKRNFLKMLE